MDLLPSAPTEKGRRPGAVSGLWFLGLVGAILVVNIAWGYRSCGQAGEVGVGKPAPRFMLPLLSSERDPVGPREDGLNSDPGSPALVCFVATWSARSIDELALLRRLHSRYEGRGLRILIVDTEPGQRARVEEYLRRTKPPFPWLLDTGGVAERYGAVALPHRVLVDRDGVVRRIEPASRLADAKLEQELRRAIETVLP